MQTVRKEKKLKKFTSKMQGKLLLVFCVILAVMSILIGRIVYINQKDGDRYAKRVLSQQTYSNSVLPYQRGTIMDRKGTVLATSQKVYNLILDVKYMLSDENYLKPTIKALTESYDEISEDMIQELVDNKSESQYNILIKKLTYDQMMVLKDKMLDDEDIQGVFFEEDYIRTYPYNNLASHLLGFTSSGNVGNWGIEQYYNDELNGTNGREYGYIDSELNLERTVEPAVNGNNIISTIDANIQGIVQNHIKAFNEEYGSKNLGVIVMNPNNGEILSLATNTEYDLNNPYDLTSFYTKKELSAMDEDKKMESLNSIWRNFAISDAFEPGSTFKPVTISAALEEAKVSLNDTYICDGYEEIAGVKIRCSKRAGHGKLTLQEGLMYSCNDVLMQVVAKEGRNIFYNYQKKLGFGSKTGIDLYGESTGILVPKKNLNATEIATSSFGQTFTSTMIQIASSYSSLINGGSYYEPHVVKEIQNDKGMVVKSFDGTLIRKTVSEETSKFIREAMYMTVKEGTAKPAGVAGYTVGGKTGTAQKLPRGSGKYLVSFVGNVPADKPEIVIYVVIDEPQNVVTQADSSLATKLTGKILKDILPFLEIYPSDVSEDEQTDSTPVLPSTGNVESINGNNTNKNTEETTNSDSSNKKTTNSNKDATNQNGNEEDNLSNDNSTTEQNNDSTVNPSENGNSDDSSASTEEELTEDLIIP